MVSPALMVEKIFTKYCSAMHYLSRDVRWLASMHGEPEQVEIEFRVELVRFQSNLVLLPDFQMNTDVTEL